MYHYIIYYITMFDGFLIVTLFHHETSPQKSPISMQHFFDGQRDTPLDQKNPGSRLIFPSSMDLNRLAVKRRSASLPWAMKRPGSFFWPLRLGWFPIFFWQRETLFIDFPKGTSTTTGESTGDMCVLFWGSFKSKIMFPEIEVGLTSVVFSGGELL